MNIDLSSEFGAKVARRLQEEQVIWLTTVTTGGTPQPNPVWFYWDGETFLIYTQPTSFKMRNIERNPRVSLNFNTDEEGEDVVVFTGEVFVDPEAPGSDQVPQYVEKYRHGIASLGWTPESMAADFSVALRIRPEKLRGF